MEVSVNAQKIEKQQANEAQALSRPSRSGAPAGADPRRGPEPRVGPCPGCARGLRVLGRAAVRPGR